MSKTVLFALSFCALVTTATSQAQTPLGTDFTYQGQLKGGGMPEISTADFQLSLFDSANGGNQIGSTLNPTNVAIVNGLFTITLDFGASAFQGNARWIEVAVRSPAGGGGFTTLAPRHPLTAAPYALQTRGIFVDEAGRVGIGTSNPSGKLDIQAANDSSVLRGLRTGGGLAHNLFIDSGGNGSMELRDAAGTPRINLGPANSTYFNYGRVGVGTSDPLGGLHVKAQPNSPAGTLALEGTTYTFVSFYPDGAAQGRKAYIGYPGLPPFNDFQIVNETLGGKIELVTSGVISLDANGGVGIGTATPSRRLTVWDTMSVEASPGFMPILGIPRPGTTTFRVSMFIDPDGDGVVYGDRKDFREINPEDPTTDIWYSCIEGPEAAMYVRGTARLEHGRGLIELPAHFRSLASEHGMTVQLTPLSAQSKGLAVTRKGLGGVEVTELADGQGDYEFDWEVKTVRKRYKNARVIKPWDEILPSDSNRETAWQERLREIERRDDAASHRESLLHCRHEIQRAMSDPEVRHASDKE